MSMLSVSKVKGITELRTKLSRYLRKLDKIETVDLDNLAAKIKARGAELAPISDLPSAGRLKRGVYAARSSDKRRPGIYAGATAISDDWFNYAPLQHENEHFRHPRGGQAHFVLQAVQENLPGYIEQIKRELGTLD